MFPSSDVLIPEGNDGSQAARDAPDTGQSEAGQPRTYGDNNVELPEDLQNALLALIQEAQRMDIYQRRIELVTDRRHRFYERGIQHVYEDLRTGTFIQGTPGALVPDPNSDGQIQCGQYLNSYNIFGRCIEIYTAKLTENPVGIDFQPDEDTAADHQAAQQAETYRILFDRSQDSKAIDRAIIRMYCTSGRVISWTRTVADAQRWGVDENGQPKRRQVTTIFGTLETKVPVMAQGLENCPFVIITEDPHVYQAKMEHPEFADKITEDEGNGVSDTQFERMVRIGALQGNTASYQLTDTYNWYVERKYFWFRPAMLMAKCLDGEYIDMEAEEGSQTRTLREGLAEAFPDGGVAIFIGEKYVGSRNVSMDDELAVSFPYEGDGMSRMAIMYPAVPIQDDFNDDMNNFHEVKVTGWPSTWVNVSEKDIAAFNDQQAAPYCFRALKSQLPGRDAKMAEQFYREPDPLIPPTFMQHTEYMTTQLLQFILAIPSAVQGAGMPDQKTKGGYFEAINQAMGQLALVYGQLRQHKANIYRQAALLAARDAQQNQGQAQIAIPGSTGTMMLNPADLGKGRFLAHPDKDSGYPETTDQKRNTWGSIFQLINANPMIAQQVFQSPDNWEAFARIMGIPEITLPEAKARQKQQAEIEQLLKMPPQEPTPDELDAALTQHADASIAGEAAGQPVPPFDPATLVRSSVPVGKYDFHDWEFEMCREFLSDWPKVQQQLMAGNGAGVQNVILHADEHQKYIAAAAAQQMAEQAAMQQPNQPQGNISEQ